MACITSVGYTAAESARSGAWVAGQVIRGAAMIASAAVELKGLYDNYKRQYKIQSRTIKISETEQRHLEQHFWPRELEFLDAYTDPEADRPLRYLEAMYSRRMKTNIVKSFSKLFKETECRAGRYCKSSTDKRLHDLTMARGQALTNAHLLAKLMAFSEVQKRNDRDYKRRVQAISLGRSLMQQAANLMSQAQQGFATAASVHSQNLSSIMEAFGYDRGRGNSGRGGDGGGDSTAPYTARERADVTPAPPEMLARDPITDVPSMTEYENSSPYDWGDWRTFLDFDSAQKNSTQVMEGLQYDTPAFFDMATEKMNIADFGDDGGGGGLGIPGL